MPKISDELTKKVITVFGDALREHSPKKKGNSWYIRSPETVSVVNLQKSQWSKQFYVNIGIFCSPIEENLPEFKADIRFRIENFLPERHRTSAVELFDLENSLGENERLSMIHKLVTDLIDPALEDFKNLQTLRKMYQEGAFGSAPTSPNGRRILVGESDMRGQNQI